jgi:hypothetical protein
MPLTRNTNTTTIIASNLNASMSGRASLQRAIEQLPGAGQRGGTGSVVAAPTGEAGPSLPLMLTVTLYAKLVAGLNPVSLKLGPAIMPIAAKF